MKELPVFFAAPHRAMFLGGTVQGLLAMLWWATDLGARHGGLYGARIWLLPADVPPSWLHGLLMIYSFFPFFIFGFLMTAAPRWQGASPVPGRVYVPSFILMAAGWLSVDAGLLLPALPSAFPIGLASVLTGWLVGASALLRVALHPNPERRHAWAVVLALGLGASGVAAFLAYVSGGSAWAVRWALLAGIWGFLLPVFMTVAHRMLPFFSSNVIPKYVLRRPYWALGLLLVACAGHMVLSLAGQDRWLWLMDLPAAATALYLSVLWQFRRSLSVRILSVLHIAFAWLAVALALHGVQSLAWHSGRAMLGLAPLHALTIGFFASMLLGMVSRVTLGHSGRGIAADAVLWLAFWGMQGAAVLRILADLPPDCCAANPFNPTWLAVLLWLLAFGGWAARYAPAYWRPRADGQPG